jgi:hypothetical protein
MDKPAVPYVCCTPALLSPQWSRVCWTLWLSLPMAVIAPKAMPLRAPWSFAV